MKFTETRLSGAWLIDLQRHGDERGSFARTWCRREFLEHGLDMHCVQANLSTNTQRGTLRGMHYQRSPHTETKLVRCIRGAIYDVIVDLRPGSVTCRQWLGVELSADTGRALLVPEGFAHGFITLTDETELLYLMSDYYQPDAGTGIRYDDPAIGIDWPQNIEVISDQDLAWPDLEVSPPGTAS